MSSKYNFILAWKGEDGKYVFSRRPMIITKERQNIFLQHIRDIDCSALLPVDDRPYTFKVHLIAFPKGLRFTEWMSQICFQLNRSPSRTISSPFKSIAEAYYTVDKNCVGQRVEVNSTDCKLSFLVHDYDNGRKLYLDTPQIKYNKENLDNQILSTIEI